MSTETKTNNSILTALSIAFGFSQNVDIYNEYSDEEIKDIVGNELFAVNADVDKKAKETNRPINVIIEKIKNMSSERLSQMREKLNRSQRMVNRDNNHVVEKGRDE